MGYSKEVFDVACKVIESRRRNAVLEAEQRKYDFYKMYPRAEEIEKSLSKTAIQVGRAILNGQNTVEQLTRLKEYNLKLQNELSNILKGAGLPNDYLEVHYSCPICSDEGYVDGKMCGCLKQALRAEAYNRLNSLSPLELSTFESFSLDYYSNRPLHEGVPSPRRRMTNIFNFCEDYAVDFSLSSENLLLQGGTGLGKTHLSLAIAKAAIDKGYGVIYTSAPNIISRLERERFRYSRDSENETEQYLINCDLLILDDLGTEFATSFSNASVYNLINSRIMLRKPTIISTNLTIKELERNYTERLTSRIIENYIKLEFLGEDVRQKKCIMKRK